MWLLLYSNVMVKSMFLAISCLHRLFVQGKCYIWFIQFHRIIYQQLLERNYTCFCTLCSLQANPHITHCWKVVSWISWVIIWCINIVANTMNKLFVLNLNVYSHSTETSRTVFLEHTSKQSYKSLRQHEKNLQLQDKLTNRKRTMRTSGNKV